MQSKRLSRLNLWLEKKLSYPGCTDKQLQGNITALQSQIYLSFFSLLILIFLLFFSPRTTIYIHYLIAFITLYILSLSLQLLFPMRHLVIATFVGSAMHLMTFYTIFRLGGIPTSGGLIFAGISNILASVTRKSNWLPISMFSLFCFLVVMLMVFKPWLHVPDQMTPAINSVLWTARSMILTGGALGFVFRFIRQQEKLDEIEADHLKEINEIRGRIFTNITHEFRTPLTVMLGMTDLIRSQPEQWTKTGLEKIKTHGNNLLRLVNQMLNLAKIETGTVAMNFVRRDIDKYLAFLVEQFHSEALRRKIDLRYASAGEPFEMDFDPEKLMHILTNLVSNALKYTPEGGRIDVITCVTENGRMYSIRVKDTGIGIEREHLEHLFDRFFRVESQLSPGGTGIGLALTKELVQLLNGTISVESIKGIGSEFTVLLPITHDAPVSDIRDEADLFMVGDNQSTKVISSGEPIYPGQSHEEFLSIGAASQADLPLLLIIEDHSDVVVYLRAILKNEYRIEVAGNGKIGLEKALEIIPDIILSDVMMPVMDGIELLEKVKNDTRTSHIPVVMLTAKADIDSRLEGLERGADAYLAKPVDERELHIQLKNLVELRKKLYERYRSLEKYPETSDINIKKEDAFMMKVRQVLEANLQDDEFGITQLCGELAVSHSNLYKKIRSLSNITIADYIKSLRLRKARELLLTTRLNVTEVTFATGFKNLSHFSREFAREYGKSPSEFRKN